MAHTPSRPHNPYQPQRRRSPSPRNGHTPRLFGPGRPGGSSRGESSYAVLRHESSFSRAAKSKAARHKAPTAGPLARGARKALGALGVQFGERESAVWQPHSRGSRGGPPYVCAVEPGRLCADRGSGEAEKRAGGGRAWWRNSPFERSCSARCVCGVQSEP